MEHIVIIVRSTDITVITTVAFLDMRLHKLNYSYCGKVTTLRYKITIMKVTLVRYKVAFANSKLRENIATVKMRHKAAIVKYKVETVR